MSASLLVAIPFALLAIVLLFGFVGCDALFGLDPLPDPGPPFTRYTPKILEEPTLVAYWPLGEVGGDGSIATDLKGAADGTTQRNGLYIEGFFQDDPSILSAAAPTPGSLPLELGQEGIVPGDTVSPFDDPSRRATCVRVDGGYVSVRFNTLLNPPRADGFTVEAWVRVEWSPDATAAIRAVVLSLDTAGGGVRGYALLARPILPPPSGEPPKYIWEGRVGTGVDVTIAGGPEILFDTTNHLVLTYDGNVARLFVNGVHTTSTATIDYQPNTNGFFFMGGGAFPPFQPDRWPWVGKIQCVAFYKGALPPEQVAKHTAFGNGIDVS
jgi:hypothetical protein